MNFNLSNWNVSSATTMQSAFGGCQLFTGGGIGSWNVSSVTNMLGMFSGCINFNEDISGWDVSSVTNMAAMFSNCFLFDAPIEIWDVSGCSQMAGMFQLATNFNRPIGSWNVELVSDMGYMFDGATNFNQSLGNWNTSYVNSMTNMFAFCTNFNGDVDNWDVSAVTNMEKMFYAATSFNRDISAWVPSQVSTMFRMFNSATSFNSNGGNIGVWGNNTSNVTNMCEMFSQASSFDQDLSNWNVSLVNNMSFMFNGATNFNNGGNSLTWSNLSNVTNMNSMFLDATSFNQDISSWDVSSVTDMGFMFYGASSFNQDITLWNVSSVTNMEYMFASSAFNQKIGNWDVSSVTNMQWMFASCPQTWSLNNWNISSVTTIAGMFYNCPYNEDLYSWDTTNVTIMESAFMFATAFNGDIGSWSVSNVYNFTQMFYQAISFNQNIGSWSVSGANTMASMFYQATSFNQDITYWDTTNVTEMGGMFSEAISFNQPIGSWVVSNVGNISGMFYGATAFDQDISNWDVSSVVKAENFMDLKDSNNYSSTNYDNLLISWSALSLQSNVNLNMGTILSTSASYVNKISIITNFNWIITDGDGYFPGGEWFLDGNVKNLTLQNNAKYFYDTSHYRLDPGSYDRGDAGSGTDRTPQQITLEAWMNPIDFNSDYALVSCDGIYHLRLTGVFMYNTEIRFAVKTNSNFFEFSIPISPTTYLRKWTHVVGTYQDGTMSIYLDGVLQGVTTSQTGTMSYSSTATFFVGSLDGYIEHFNGKIGRPSIWNYPFTDAGVSASYANYYPNFLTEATILDLDAGTNSSYPGTGLTWYDLGVYNNDFVINNGVTWSSINGSMVFDGSSGFAVINYNDEFNLSTVHFKIEVEVLFNSVGSSQMIISSDTYGSSFDWCIYVQNSTTVIVYSNATTTNITATVPALNTGQWYTFKVTSSNGDVRIYLDGTIYGGGQMSISCNSSNVTIGCASWNNPGLFLDGEIRTILICREL